MKRIITFTLMLTLIVSVFALNETMGADETVNGYPSKKIKVIVPFSPGGGSDRVARAMASVAPEYFPVAVHVICMPGAGGAEAARFVARSKPDGYTLLHGTFGPSLSKPILENVGYTNDDFRAVLRKQAPMMGLFTKKDKWKTLEGFMKDAKANPGKYTYSSSGAGGAQHFPMEILQQKVGIKLIHIPYDGGSDALRALLGGHVDLTFGTFGSYFPAVKSGDIRALAVSRETRAKGKLLKDIPTFKELGYDFTWVHWRAIFAPAKTPDKIVAYLEDRFRKCLKDPSFVKLLKKLGEEPDPMGAAKFDAFYDKQYEDIKRVATGLGLIKK